jgi:hypothetical protein
MARERINGKREARERGARVSGSMAREREGGGNEKRKVVVVAEIRVEE